MSARARISAIGTQMALGLLWLLHWLPLPLLARLGRGLGALLWRLVPSRRKVVLRNLELCFPDWSPERRETLARESFKIYARTFLEHGLLWWGSEKRLRKLIHVEGDIGFAAQAGQPVMWLVPHFMALDFIAPALQWWQPLTYVSIYQRQSNPVMDRIIRDGRLRFGKAELFSREESARPLMRRMRQGDAAFANLPDMDFGPKDSAFVPFFGVEACTLLAPSRMARTMNMRIQPIIGEILPGGQGYRVRFLEPWSNWPTEDAWQDTAQLNRWLEERILECPEQYLWMHKRFKTRPEGEPSVY